MVMGGKAISSSITKVAGCLVFLSAGEANERQTVVVGDVVHPLAVEASGGSVPEMVGTACYFSWLTRRVASCGGLRQCQQR